MPYAATTANFQASQQALLELQMCLASGSPTWNQDFCSRMVTEYQFGRIPADLWALLLSGGVTARGGSVTAPLELMRQLTLYRDSVAPSTGTGGQLYGLEGALTSGANGPRWEHVLPRDLQRAALDIYKNMRAAGVASVREWLGQSFAGQKTGTLWLDLWTAAATVDYILGQAAAGGEAQLVAVLSTNDTVEILMRRLASYTYASRTRDAVGAMHMLAIRAPGSSSDVAPTWLVDSATTHSRTEYLRDGRVHEAAARQRRWNPPAPKGDKGGKARGRGGQGKGGTVEGVDGAEERA